MYLLQVQIASILVFFKWRKIIWQQIPQQFGKSSNNKDYNMKTK